MSSDSVGGVITNPIEVSLSFPLTQVRVVEESEWHSNRTFFLVVGLAGLAFVGVVTIIYCVTGGVWGDGCVGWQ